MAEGDYERMLARRVEELNEFQRAMLDLDVALTGNPPTQVVKQIHHYPDTFEKWYTMTERLTWYLSDGGYSRVVWSAENKNLFLTYNSTSKVKSRWDAALPQRQRAEEVILRHYQTLGESVDPFGRHWIAAAVRRGHTSEEIADALTRCPDLGPP
jgi:hypothetical protein